MLLKNTLLDFLNTTSPDMDLSMAAIIAAVISPVWRQAIALSEGSEKLKSASILDT